MRLTLDIFYSRLNGLDYLPVQFNTDLSFTYMHFMQPHYTI